MAPIVYSLVSRGKTILAESTTTSGNFEQIARMVLPKLQPALTRQSIEGETHTFHILIDGQVFFLCLCDKLHPGGTALAFEFLNEVKRRFELDLDLNELDLERAIAYAFNAQFSPVLAELMQKYNAQESSSSSGNAEGGEDIVRKVRGQLEDVKDVMRTNIDSLLNRGERIDLLVESTERLSQASFKFQESATRLKQQMWWENTRFRIAMGALLAFVFILFFLS